MEEIKLSDDVIEQIKEIEQMKDFNRYYLTKEQELLIDGLILNEELKKRYMTHGLCKECKQFNTDGNWCQTCNGKRFQWNFSNWTSGNQNIDEFIQRTQLKAKVLREVIEWIEYDRFYNIEYLAKEGFGITYKATWKDGYIYRWDSESDQWKRWGEDKVVLKCLHNSTGEFLKEVVSNISSPDVVRCYGITKDPEINNFMMVISGDIIGQIKGSGQELLIDKLILNEELKEHYKHYGLCKECKQPKAYYEWCQTCNSKWFQQNFPNWTSGNQNIDEFIQRIQLKAKGSKVVLEWIEYDRFENIEYLAKGGFGTIYKATWKDGFIEKWDSENNQWKRNEHNIKVALKCLHNSQDITREFLKEVESHITVNSSPDIVQCYGITKDPKNSNFMIVMKYAPNGSFRQYLNNNFTSLNWNQKINNLYDIARGLTIIHDKGLIHNDFHCGNILSNNSGLEYSTLITDLGLCRPANEKTEKSEKSKKCIYGVLPYVAPEVLREKKYTQASDIYGFGIISYEVFTGYPPYYNIEHDEILAIKICNGQRPKSNYKIPQLILDIINQCWHANPLKRLKAKELEKLFKNLYYDTSPYHINNKNPVLDKQIEEADYHNKNLPLSSHTSTHSYTTHSQAIYTSRPLDYGNLPEPNNNNDDESFGMEYSETTKIDFTKLNIKDESN